MSKEHEEQAAKYIADWYADGTHSIIELEEKIISRFNVIERTQPLNLDVKVDKDWVEVKEPNPSNHVYGTAAHHYQKEVEAYQQAKTVREKIAELEDKGFWGRMAAKNKQRAELAEEQLQASESKTKELVIKAFNDGKKFIKNGGSSTTGNQYFELLNKQ